MPRMYKNHDQEKKGTVSFDNIHLRINVVSRNI